jgi:hypothetical protein
MARQRLLAPPAGIRLRSSLNKMVDKRKKSKKTRHQKQDQISGGAVETNSGHSHHHLATAASFNGEDLIYVSPSRVRVISHPDNVLDSARIARI